MVWPGHRHPSAPSDWPRNNWRRLSSSSLFRPRTCLFREAQDGNDCFLAPIIDFTYKRSSSCQSMFSIPPPPPLPGAVTVTPQPKTPSWTSIWPPPRNWVALVEQETIPSNGLLPAMRLVFWAPWSSLPREVVRRLHRHLPL